MVETTKRLIEKVNQLKNDCMKNVTADDWLELDTDTFGIVKSCFELMDMSTELMLKQAECMESQSNKLDELLAIAKAEIES